MPTFSFLVPTHREDRPLARCLHSIAPQLGVGDEVIVIGDTHDGALPGVERLVASFGEQFRYVSLDAGRHDYGHSQLNYGLELATRDYIHCNDDDDIWLPTAVSMMRIGATAFPKRPLLFRFRSYFGTIYWEAVGVMERNHIGGHCLVAPNIPGKVGRFSSEYSGDFEWIESTVNAHGGPKEAIWLTDLICQARPS